MMERNDFMTWIELVKEFFPNISDEEADFILWEKTAFPMGGLEVVTQQLKELSDKA
jgi:hypothetical protein